MEECGEGESRVHTDVAVCVASTEQLAGPSKGNKDLRRLEASKRSRFFGLLNGPYQQHQLLVTCVEELKLCNSVDSEVKGRMLPVAPDPTSTTGKVLSLLVWIISICVPFVFITLGYVIYDTWMVCGCAIVLCLLISCQSIAIFFVLHNQKIAKRLWFISKIELEHYCGHENSMVDVTLDNTMTMQFLSASQKSQVITRLARSKDHVGVMMMCSKSFWVRRVQDPLLCLLFLIIISLLGLVLLIDLMRRNHLG